MNSFGDPYQVKVSTGVLVTCDSAAKQILLHIDSAREGPSKFILRDVDDTHVLVKGIYLEEIKDLLQEEVSVTGPRIRPLA
ncbi:TFIIH basal transcription factor complex TTD-A subunit, partial [Tremellales sp. Uapishka_1]